MVVAVVGPAVKILEVAGTTVDVVEVMGVEAAITLRCNSCTRGHLRLLGDGPHGILVILTWDNNLVIRIEVKIWASNILVRIFLKMGCSQHQFSLSGPACSTIYRPTAMTPKQTSTAALG
ncbi:hypothetical protein L2E82_50183 [Cichorium intybus]|nr:hypothetical protein L2E82_50183 [Cichorium intybus]